MLSTLARNTIWANSESLFFSCPVRPTKLGQPRNTNLVRSIRYNDINALAKSMAAAEGLDGNFGPTSFKRNGITNHILRDGLTVAEGCQESRHASEAAFGRYLVGMTGPTRLTVSGPRVEVPKRTTRAPTAVSNELLHLNNTGRSANQNQTTTNRRESRQLMLSEIYGRTSSPPRLPYPDVPGSHQDDLSVAEFNYSVDEYDSIASSQNSHNSVSIPPNAILKPFDSSPNRPSIFSNKIQKRSFERQQEENGNEQFDIHHEYGDTNLREPFQDDLKGIPYDTSATFKVSHYRKQSHLSYSSDNQSMFARSQIRPEHERILPHTQPDPQQADTESVRSAQDDDIEEDSSN
jgi:hypothetical protein